MNEHEREVVESIDPVVEENLKWLADPEKKMWWPAQFFSFMEEEGYQTRLHDMREHAKGLSDELLVVLVGDMVTEEALPTYASRLSYMFPDRTGVGEKPWDVWQRGWNGEENQHGDALRQYLLLTGRVNMKAVDWSVNSLIQKGFRQDPGLYNRGIFYPMFQEPATRISHNNVATLAKEQGDETLADICRKIAGDEHRHAQFYFAVGQAIFDKDPEHAMIRFGELMMGTVTMPAELMTDRNSQKRPLFDRFAEVASSIGVYTPFDYANILDSLNSDLGIADRSVSGSAAQAQENLMNLPDRIRRVGERKKDSDRTTSKFEWVYAKAV